jgi:hypothetical protein
MPGIPFGRCCPEPSEIHHTPATCMKCEKKRLIGLNGRLAKLSEADFHNVAAISEDFT